MPHRPSPPQEAHTISISPETTEEHRSPEDGNSAEEEEEEEEDEEESDDEGWITPSNLKQVQQDLGHCDMAPADIQVGCVTTDFAMQVGADGGGRCGLAPASCSASAAWALCKEQLRAASFNMKSCQFSPQQQPLQSLSGSLSLAFLAAWAGRHRLGLLGCPLTAAPFLLPRCRTCCCRWASTCWQ